MTTSYSNGYVIHDYFAIDAEDAGGDVDCLFNESGSARSELTVMPRQYRSKMVGLRFGCHTC